MLDLACTDNCFSRFVASLCEGGNIRYVHTEDVDVWILDLLETVQTGKESSPKHYNDIQESNTRVSLWGLTMPPVLSIRYAVEA